MKYKHWDKIADNYNRDYVTNPNDTNAKENNSIAKIIKNHIRTDQRILDIACGSGFLPYIMQGQGVKFQSYVGVDISQKMINLHKANIPQNDVTLIKLSYHKAKRIKQIKQLKRKEKLFDAVVCMYSAQHLTDTEIKLYKSLLKPNGIMVMMFLTARSEYEAYNRYQIPDTNDYIKRSVSEIQALLPNSKHINFYRYHIFLTNK